VTRARRLLLAVLAALCPAALTAAQARTFVVDPGRSEVLVRLGRAGLLELAGHEHVVAVPIAAGTVVADTEDPGRSSVTTLPSR
jgi:hypothetical protein